MKKFMDSVFDVAGWIDAIVHEFEQIIKTKGGDAFEEKYDSLPEELQDLIEPHMYHVYKMLNKEAMNDMAKEYNVKQYEAVFDEDGFCKVIEVGENNEE